MHITLPMTPNIPVENSTPNSAIIRLKLIKIYALIINEPL